MPKRIKTISYEAKIAFIEEARVMFEKQNSFHAVMMCAVIIEDLARLRDLEK